jgi:hypothetical protein
MEATGNVTILVNPVAPTLPWATPSAITYGTALGAQQLNANSTVAGTFVYSPSAGTVMSTGPHTLMATFTPTDCQRDACGEPGYSADNVGDTDNDRLRHAVEWGAVERQFDGYRDLQLFSGGGNDAGRRIADAIDNLQTG